MRHQLSSFKSSENIISSSSDSTIEGFLNGRFSNCSAIPNFSLALAFLWGPPDLIGAIIVGFLNGRFSNCSAIPNFSLALAFLWGPPDLIGAIIVVAVIGNEMVDDGERRLVKRRAGEDRKGGITPNPTTELGFRVESRRVWGESEAAPRLMEDLLTTTCLRGVAESGLSSFLLYLINFGVLQIGRGENRGDDRLSDLDDDSYGDGCGCGRQVWCRASGFRRASWWMRVFILC
ncbi:hypothetical protein CASFOL_006957 [Castilleja foliolosa]|uniref:Uncharacterized protein n=1 Tax=Castilleja foliolosa TaxID=1961234 RepID=A0ABD3EC00_9LAMI